MLGAILRPGAGGSGTLSGPIVNDGLTAVVEDVLQLPSSAGGPPLARLNVLREAPDGSGRLFVNDLRGPLHVIESGVARVFMDLDAIFAELKTAPGLASGFVSFAFHPDFATNGRFYTVHTENVVGGTPAPNLVPAIATSVEHHSVLNEWQLADPTDDACEPTGPTWRSESSCSTCFGSGMSIPAGARLGRTTTGKIRGRFIAFCWRLVDSSRRTSTAKGWPANSIAA